MLQAHRAGPLKQKNKPHRTKHRSKRALSALGRKATKKSVSKPVKRYSKNERRNQLEVKRKLKQDKIKARQKFNAVSGLPVLLTLVGISSRTCSDSVVEHLKDLGLHISSREQGNLLNMRLKGLKSRFQLLVPPTEMPLPCIDAAKASDYVVFVCHSNDSLSELDSNLIDIICQHSLPHAVLLIKDLKKEQNMHKRGQIVSCFSQYIQQRAPNCHVQAIDDLSDAFSLLRKLALKNAPKVSSREGRSFIVAEKWTTESDEFSLSGFVRGALLSPDRLMYIAGVGTCQIKSIEILDDEMKPTGHLSLPNNDDRIMLPEPLPESPVSYTENIVEDDEPQPETLAVPKGTSEYQASWLQFVPSSDDEPSEEEEGDESMDEPDNSTTIGDDDDITVGDSTVATTGRRVTFAEDVKFADDDDNNPSTDEEDKPDPDEIPAVSNARHHLREYRGLPKFRSTPWEDEFLPDEYALLSQFENYRNAVKCIRKTEGKRQSGVEVGLRVRVVFENVPDLCKEKLAWSNLTAFSLFPHEEKMSLCNILLNRSILSGQLLKSNQNLIFAAGIRRFSASALFSEITNADKFKCEKHFAPDTTLMASVYAPIMMAPCPVLAFTKYIDGSLHLVASGHVVSCDPGRVILDRAVLTGKPYKINGKKAVVRGMFTNPDDVHHFKSIPVTSKYGRKGYIQDSIGTRGFMKCKFDRPLKSQDTVRMCLYKRIFPPWNYKDLQELHNEKTC